ncbi:MAG: tRNA 2-thiouridine(34) synthase MnmA [Fimbriimonadaceae bacterium]|nr:tRNA 2-thiouridine(34) synthase MnmA [Alphaproteobacteria bacterium]
MLVFYANGVPENCHAMQKSLLTWAENAGQGIIVPGGATIYVHKQVLLLYAIIVWRLHLGLDKVLDVMTTLPDPQTVIESIGLPGDPASTRIVVAMSGGVDSSVVAGLLKHAGYDVVGVTLQLYDHGDAMHRSGSCCSGQDIHDARRVAEILGFPHYVLDYESRFREAVMDSFADSYVSGETPIPCIACNQKIKFKDLLATAKDLGAAALATGHYVMSRPSGNPDNARREMYQAADLSKDQSYFLFATTPDQLDYLRFPLGALEKSETRQLALAMGLPVADKSDSQDICFVPTGHYADVVEKLRPGAAEPGDIVHIDGRVLGRHGGIVNFTIGQRRGIDHRTEYKVINRGPALIGPFHCCLNQ